MRKLEAYLCCLCMAIMMVLMSSSVYGATLKSVTFVERALMEALKA